MKFIRFKSITAMQFFPSIWHLLVKSQNGVPLFWSGCSGWVQGPSLPQTQINVQGLNPDSFNSPYQKDILLM